MYWLTVAALISIVISSGVSVITSFRSDRRNKRLTDDLLSRSSSLK